MNVNLAPTLEQFIRHKVGQGAYASADDVIAASLAMMCSGEDDAWTAAARQKIREGLASARAGRVHPAEEVSAWMEERKEAWRKQKGAE